MTESDRDALQKTDIADHAQSGPARSARPAGIVGWVLYDLAAQPYFTLISTFVYGPFFVSAMASSPEEGQALWGWAVAAAGFTIAVFSPILGSIADAAGRRKPWIAAFSLILVIAAYMLWHGKPNDPSTIPMVLVFFAIGTIAVEFATVFTNAMMPSLVSREALGRLSGIGWAVGYVGGLICLFIVLGLFAGSPETGKTLMGIDPIFGLDPAAREGDRASGPFTSIWYLIFILPLFLFTPDMPRRMPLSSAVSSGISALVQTIKSLRSHRNAALYLVSHMVYVDGLVALFAFGGVYAAGTFGWQTIETGIFGIILAFTGAIGAFIGGFIDDRVGPKTVVQTSLLILAAGSIGILSVDNESVFYIVPTSGPSPGDGLFASPPEWVYIGFGCLIGLVAGPLQASSRTLLVHVSPEDKMTQFFGLYALAGRVTSFVGPMAVATLTVISGSQRIGISVLVVFFIAGYIILTFVHDGRESG